MGEELTKRVIKWSPSGGRHLTESYMMLKFIILQPTPPRHAHFIGCFSATIKAATDKWVKHHCVFGINDPTARRLGRNDDDDDCRAAALPPPRQWPHLPPHRRVVVISENRIHFGQPQDILQWQSVQKLVLLSSATHPFAECKKDVISLSIRCRSLALAKWILFRLSS